MSVFVYDERRVEEIERDMVLLEEYLMEFPKGDDEVTNRILKKLHDELVEIMLLKL